VRKVHNGAVKQSIQVSGPRPMKARLPRCRALLLLLPHSLVGFASCYSPVFHPHGHGPAGPAVPGWLPRTSGPASRTSKRLGSYQLPASAARRWGSDHRCHTRIRRGTCDRFSTTALGLHLPSAAASSRWTSKDWLRNHDEEPPSASKDIHPSPAAWIELSNEEAAVLEQRRKLVRQIDDCEAALRRLRYDRVDYLVRQQHVQTQQQQEQHAAADGAAAWASLSASRKVGTNHHGNFWSSGLKNFNWRRSEPTETVRRSVIKALLWRVLAESITYAMALQWFRSAAAASRFVASTCLLKLAAMVVWERAFARRPPRNSSNQLNSQTVENRPHRSPAYSESSLPKDGVIRSLAKALTWRALAVTANSYLLLRMFSSGAEAVGEVAAAAAVVGNGAVLVRVLRMEAFKAALLFVYERIWNRVDWGKIRDSSQGVESNKEVT
jgi:uncharacterized membrane protein